jgi:hypothetical protein
VPQEKPVLGVQDSEEDGAVPAPAHWLLSTVCPSDCKQVTERVVEADPESATQVPVRLWAKFAPQPVAGVHAE